VVTERGAKGTPMSESILSASILHPAPSAAVLVLRGPLDLGTAARMDHMMRAELTEGRHHLVVDLSDVTFCDSTAISALLRLHRAATGAGGWIRLAGVPDQVRRVLQVTNVDRVLHRFPGVEEALTGR
jgi:anti-sigma B factor antagonist